MRDIESTPNKCVDVKGLKKQEEYSRQLRYILQQLNVEAT